MELTKHEVALAIKAFDAGHPKKGYITAKYTLRVVAQLFVGGTLIYKDEYAIETRECSECKNFKPIPYDISICKKYLMGVASKMKVNYEKSKGTCFESK